MIKKLVLVLSLISINNVWASIEADQSDHQRTSKERAVRVDRIHSFVSQIVEADEKIDTYNYYNRELKFARKIGQICSRMFDIYRQDLLEINSCLAPLNKDFKSIYYSQDSRIVSFKSAVNKLFQHRNEENQLLVQEGFMNDKIEFNLDNNFNSPVFIQAKCLNFSEISLGEFKNIVDNDYTFSSNTYSQYIYSVLDSIAMLYERNARQLQFIEKALEWYQSQINILKSKKKELADLSIKNLGWLIN